MAAHPRVFLLVSAVLACALSISHLPSLVLDAQFYADDGGWYQAAYSQGPLRSLAHPAAGYFVMFQRLVASAASPLPTVAVPTVFNVVAIVVGAVGICYLLSSRMSVAIPSLWANLTNTQWRLGLVALLVVFARPARAIRGWLLDAALFATAGLTGPASLLLEPIVAWLWFRERTRRHRYLLILNTLCAAIQLAAIVVRAGTQRSSSALAAGPFPLLQMVARQVTLGLAVGAHGISHLVSTHAVTSVAILAVLAFIPLAVCGWAAWRGPRILRALCFLALFELSLALVAPQVPAPRWQSLARPANITEFHPGGIRYFLYPLLAFATSLGWIAVRGGRNWLALRRFGRRARPRDWGERAAGLGAAGVLVVALIVGVPADWRYPPYIDEHWSANVQKVEAARPGTVVVIPINPRGWELTLTAR
ncbi:MAG: hypothetical protein E6J45_09195 [Chloroflexi bacterium]|nr:MAG: hypothetical protein E6J45_09195 [Chloroflexota bacterium]